MAPKGEFDESKHPRAPDGKFGSGTGTAKPAGAGGADSAGSAGGDVGAEEGTEAPESAAKKPKGKKPAGKPKAGSAKFNATPHQKKIAKHRAAEAKHRQASLDAKKKMAALKAKAKKATPKQKAALKKKFEALKAKREALKEKAAEAKEAKIAATQSMQEARVEHREKIKAGKKPSKPKKPKAASSDDDGPEGEPMSTGDYQGWQKSSIDGPGHSDAARAAMKVYSGNDYGDINDAFRKGKPLQEKHESIVDNIDAAMEKSTVEKPLKVYRGISSMHFVAHLKPGAVFTDKAYMSTTVDGKVAEKNFALGEGGAVFHITVPKGAKALPMTSQGEFPKEKEVLLPRGTSLKVKRVEKHANGTTIFHVSVVTGKPRKPKSK